MRRLRSKSHQLPVGVDWQRYLELSDDVEEYPFVVESEVAQIIGEAAEIVADANLEVVADMAVQGEQRTIIGCVRFGHGKHPGFDQRIPALDESDVGPKDSEVIVTVAWFDLVPMAFLKLYWIGVGDAR